MSECKQHHWPNEEGGCPYCEIERLRNEIANDVIFKALRERIEELESENVQLKQGYTAIRNDMARVSKAAKEVQQKNKDINQQMDRLCDDNVKLNDEYDELQKMFTAAAAHAEELELGAEELNNQIEDLNKRILAIWEEHGYKITDAQIGLAWAYFDLCENEEERDLLRMLFEKLGIEQCEGCEGDGHYDGSFNAERGLGTCRKCDGHRWVVKK